MLVFLYFTPTDWTSSFELPFNLDISLPVNRITNKNKRAAADLSASTASDAATCICWAHQCDTGLSASAWTLALPFKALFCLFVFMFRVQSPCSCGYCASVSHFSGLHGRNQGESPGWHVAHFSCILHAAVAHLHLYIKVVQRNIPESKAGVICVPLSFFFFIKIHLWSNCSLH